MLKTWMGAAIASMAIVALAACGGHGGEEKAEEGGGGSAQTVSVVTATTQNLPRTVTASGSVSASTIRRRSCRRWKSS